MPIYTAQSYEHLIGIPGFSDGLLKTHFTLYNGYVKNTNDVSDRLKALLDEGKTGTEYAELRRRFGWEWNGMRLHEVYFGNMSKEKKEADPGSPLAQQLAKDYGSLEAWTKDFKATGAMRGIGWTALYWDAGAGRLFNSWVAEHDGGHLSGCPMIAIMDVFEHAFFVDYGTKRADYIEAFFGALDWTVLEARFAKR